MSILIEIDEKNPKAIDFFEYIKNLSYVRIIEKKHKNSLDKSIEEAKKGELITMDGNDELSNLLKNDREL